VSRFSGDARHFQLFIESASASFNEVFGHVAADVVEHMLRRPASSSAIPTFLGRLLRWKRFFESAGGGQLSEIASQGILAELLFLRDFAIRNSPTNEAAVSSWALPEPFSKDFQFPHGAVEVKCSLSREHTKVHINGERQLDDAGYSSLYLLAVMMERVLTEGFSLPETVNSIREILGTGIARFLFEDKLLDFGYLDAHSTQYSQRYILHRLRAFHVTEGFPRVPPMLPDGLGDLCYTVSLAACAPFEVDIDVLHSLVRGGN
jgi:hypothetical protein